MDKTPPPRGEPLAVTHPPPSSIPEKFDKELNQTADAYHEARALLESAQRIFFLGFGYHRSNMKRLQVAAYEGQIGGGTSVGLGLSDRQAIEVNGKVRLFSSNPLSKDLNSLDFLKNLVEIR